MRKTNVFFLFSLFVLLLPLQARGEDVILRVKEAQKNLRTLQADFKTTVMPSGYEIKIIEQEGKIVTAGVDRLRVDVYTPPKQREIVNFGELFDYDFSGKKYVSYRIKSVARLLYLESYPPVLANIARYLNDLSFSIEALEDGKYLISGVPKSRIEGVGRVNIYVDSTSWFPYRLAIYNNDLALRTLAEIDYVLVDEVFVPFRCSVVTNRGGEAVSITTTLESIRINERVADKTFKVD